MGKEKVFSWYKREPKKFIRGVVGLGLETIGAYAVILELIYEDEESCPNDAKWLAGIMGCTGQQARAQIEKLIRIGKLHLDANGRLVNDKATEVIKAQERPVRKRGTVVEQRVSSGRTVVEQRSDSAFAVDDVNSKINDLASTDKTRLDKRREEKKDIRPDKRDGTSPEEGSDASKPFDLAVAAYNANAEKLGWPKAVRFTPNRRKILGARLKEVGLDGWLAAMERAAQSDFLAGRIERSNGHAGWTPDIDFFSKSANLTKLIEGKYDNKAGPLGLAATAPADPKRDAMQVFKERRFWNERFGPPPDHPDCSMPSKLLKEFGFR